MTTPAALIVLVWNVLGRRFDYKKTWLKRFPRIVARIKSILPSILILTECQAAEAKEIADALGYHWANYLGSSILYSKAFTLGRKWPLRWLGTTHGALIVELSSGGKTYNVIANHLPPFAWRANYRKACVAKLRAFTRGWTDPIILGGDFNWRKTLETYVSGWLSSARVKAATISRGNYGTNGKWGPGSALDYLLTRSLKALTYTVQPATDPATNLAGSDHFPIVGTFPIPAVVVPPSPSSIVLDEMRAFTDALHAADIGYDQGQRRTFLDATGEIVKHSEADCSTICGAILRRGLAKIGLALDVSDPFSTRNFAERARAAGCQVIPFAGLGGIQAGDFLVTPAHHVEFAYSAKRFYSARFDENGHAAGGKAGNQNGRETGFVDAYIRSGGWATIVRPPTSNPKGNA